MRAPTVSVATAAPGWALLTSDGQLLPEHVASPGVPGPEPPAASPQPLAANQWGRGGGEEEPDTERAPAPGGTGRQQSAGGRADTVVLAGEATALGVGLGWTETLSWDEVGTT